MSTHAQVCETKKPVCSSIFNFFYIYIILLFYYTETTCSSSFDNKTDINKILQLLYPIIDYRIQFIKYNIKNKRINSN